MTVQPFFYSTTYHSPLGELLLASDSKNLIGLWFMGQKHFGSTIATTPLEENHNLSVFITIKSWLDHFFAGEKPPTTDLLLAPYGSEFRQKVWNILRTIPYGSITTYGEIAKRLAVSSGLTTMSAQAVGNAIAHNPISIIIPCHRVVGNNGKLTGYANGIETKMRLLQHEGIMVKLF